MGEDGGGGWERSEGHLGPSDRSRNAPSRSRGGGGGRGKPLPEGGGRGGGRGSSLDHLGPKLKGWWDWLRAYRRRLGAVKQKP